MKNNGVVVVQKTEIEDKTDCFAWFDKNKCNALVSKNCKNCMFYRTKIEFLGCIRSLKL